MLRICMIARLVAADLRVFLALPGGLGSCGLLLVCLPVAAASADLDLGLMADSQRSPEAQQLAGRSVAIGNSLGDHRSGLPSD